jgi:hypothetical protein
MELPVLACKTPWTYEYKGITLIGIKMNNTSYEMDPIV